MAEPTATLDLSELRRRARPQDIPQVPTITICGGTGCRVYGSEMVADRFRQELDAAGCQATVELQVKSTGCHGFCEQGPLVVLRPSEIMYVHVKPKDVPEIVQRTIIAGELIDRLLYVDPDSGDHISREPDVPFYKHQQRLILNLNGLIDPLDINEYINMGGYRAIHHCLGELTPPMVIDTVKRSGLRGRGGAGFPTGLKWELCRNQPGDLKYVICNADEGDPGAYMDRSIIEGNPHRVLEGMIIGAYAMGARRGYVYIRAEYPLAVKHLRAAVAQARAAGFLGRNILGSGFDFDIDITLGSGAFVCGEETALMASIEGRTGEPRPRPPFPAQRGLWGRPTNINNVKSWASVPIIIDRGPEFFASIGTPSSKGTMIFSLVGNINNTGLVEVPMGITLRQLVEDIGGGVPGGKQFKAAQIGGPSGGCIPPEHLDVQIDYDSLRSLGAIMGSGGLVIADEDTCMVDFARFFMAFTQEESCGKCVPCRIGTKAMLSTLERICDGKGQPGDLEYLTELGNEIKSASLCGLGQTAPNPVLSTLRYFREEYQAHIHQGRCPAKVCKGLISYSVLEENCTGCMVCLRSCPTGAIQGAKREVHHIDAEKCNRCGTCFSLCKFDAVQVV